MSVNAFASYTNVFLYGWLLLSLGTMTKSQFHSQKIAFFMLLMVLLSGPVEQIYKTTWSEALYLPLCVSATYCWIQFLSGKNSQRNFLISVILLALVLLTRHVGIALLAAMLFSLFYHTGRQLKEKLLCATGLVAATIPYVFWLLRTQALSGFLTGPRTPVSNPDIMLQINRFGNTIAHWIFPHFYFNASGLLLSGIMLTCLLAFFIYAHDRIPRQPGHENQAQAYPFRLISFLIVYTVAHSFLVLSSAYRFNLDPVNDRLLAPVFWSLALIAFFAIDLFWKHAQNRLRKTYLNGMRLVAAGYFLFWLTGSNAINDVLLRVLFLFHP
ncbi:hypothetical protein H8L32_11045 [Undibacterium sp. CY18W]|uniref:Glycosyltransferase RgtA/B/C/D-like domain-containing protein n=1 Tax=Undibacterium hunanense TaxID=2762292 RepID=A0ABR6ZQ72_9BURK|nr:hypothetical protein [Undibacterium hunanense]MBC3918013.1 hypothetical protein [Undibacterium hunanense]